MVKVSEIWSQLEGEVAGIGAHLYPALIHTEEGCGLIARWPSDDWRAFLAVAREVEVKLIYGYLYEFNDTEIEALGVDPDADDAAAVMLAIERHRGEPCAVAISFVSEGVIHSFNYEAEWYGDLSDHARDETGRASRHAFDQRFDEQIALLNRTDEMADPLAEAREFYAAANDAERLVVARRLVPEFDEHLQPGNYLGSHARMIIDEASRRARNVVRPRLVAEAKVNVDRYADLVRLDPDFMSATTKDDRQRIVRRIVVAELGFTDADLVRVVEQAARAI